MKHILICQAGDVMMMEEKLENTVHCVYLHGFASSPQSSKARYFASKLEELGQSVDVPDLNTPDFPRMTLSSQLETLESCLSKVSPAKPVVLFGSSMGGLIATLMAQNSPQVKAIVLFAPGFGLGYHLEDLVGPANYETWSTDGHTTVFHYAFNCAMKLNYAFVEDAKKYETANLQINIPALVFHGLNDETVPVKESEAFHKDNPNFVELHVLDSDHQLVEPLPQMWELSKAFLIKHGFVDPQSRASAK